MSQRTINRCDACGAEREDTAHALNEMVPARGIPNWGHLALTDNVGGMIGGVIGYPGTVSPVYDLCEKCIAKVIAVLGLKVPAPTMQNDWPVPLGSYATCRPKIVRRTHLQPLPNESDESDDDVGQLLRDVRPTVFVGDPSCSCHTRYKCIPETCEGHCDRCRQRALDRVKDIPLGPNPSDTGTLLLDELLAPGVTLGLSKSTFTCPKCGTKSICQSLNPKCPSCGHQDPNIEKYGPG